MNKQLVRVLFNNVILPVIQKCPICSNSVLGVLFRLHYSLRVESTENNPKYNETILSNKYMNP